MSLLFDLDGTLTDSKPGIVKSINHALARMGLPEQSEEDLVQYVGPPLNTTFASLLKSHDEQLAGKAVALFRERYFDIGWKENTPYAGVRKMLSTLVESGHQLLICTAKREDIAVRILDHFRLSNFFTSIHGSGMRLTKEKLITGLLQDERCTPDSWMIGDRAVDITSGRANGLGTVAVSWGYGSKKELSGARPDRTAECPEALTRMFPAAQSN